MRISKIGEQWAHGGGAWLNRHSNVRTGMIIASIIFIIVSLWASDRLVTRMAEAERLNMEIWANATQATTTNDINTTLIYLSRILESNPSIPTIITDQEGRIISYNNIELPKTNQEAYLYQKLATFRTGYPPIVMEGLTDPLYLYYSDSKVLQQLHIFPYIQLLVFFLFLGVAIVALVSLKKSDQNRIWEGLARETAHQLGTPTSSLMAWKQYLESTGTEEMVTNEMEKDIERLGIIADRFQKIGSAPNLKANDLQEVVLRSIHYMQPRISQQVELIPPTSTDEAIVVNGMGVREPHQECCGCYGRQGYDFLQVHPQRSVGIHRCHRHRERHPQGYAPQYLPSWSDDPSAWMGSRTFLSTPHRRGLSPRAHLRQAH